MNKCDQCNDPKYCTFEYKISIGYQKIDLCHQHAKEFWDKHKHTEVGQTLVIKH